MTKKILRPVMVLGVVALVTACGARDQGPRGVGLPFDARLSEGETRRDFSVLVRAPGATLEQARESARYEATRHCIEQTGFSDAIWAIDPATGEWAVARSAAGEPVVSGRCARR
ncbi:hypothetical protein [Roseicyclus mahoneyensis]|uniref:Lipoprotein n=1 Tax=Roseicyclus mahoneyensis TaxID=164332 RepID=A0A316GJV5_9RHOB|nr:hypothetical protein [Roseicyclus mahoneyensis]PWK61071.1 hypothetical protein C7455_103271 [Roseicyclus mahoneyensis]